MELQVSHSQLKLPSELKLFDLCAQKAKSHLSRSVILAKDKPLSHRPNKVRDKGRPVHTKLLTPAQLVEATGWQKHTVRGAISGALKKKLGLNVVSAKADGGERIYRIAS